MSALFGAEPPLFWGLAVVAVLLAGFSKAATGGGFVVLAVPLMSLAIAPPRAAAIMLPILCAMDLLGVWAYRSKVDPALLKQLIPGAVLGIAIGSLVFGIVDVRWVKGLLGAECLLFALHRLAGTRRFQAAAGRPPNAGGAVFWSTISGFTSTLAHAGGPPLMQYLLPLKLDKMRFVATSVVFFTVVNYLKLLPYAWLGLLETASLGTSLLLAPVIPIGYWIGLHFARLVPERWLYGLVNLSLLVTGIKLLWDAGWGGS